MTNNARGLMNAPAFKDAAVRVGDRDEVIRIDLTYPRKLTERPEPQRPVSGSGGDGANDGADAGDR